MLCIILIKYECIKYYYKTIYNDVDKTALFSWPHVDNLIINKIDENNMLTSIITAS